MVSGAAVRITNLRIRAFAHDMSLKRYKGFAGQGGLPGPRSCCAVIRAYVMEDPGGYGPDKVEEGDESKSNSKMTISTPWCADQHLLAFLNIHIRMANVMRDGWQEIGLHIDGSIEIVLTWWFGNDKNFEMQNCDIRVLLYTDLPHTRRG